jgi:hypothetical protein
MEMSRFLAQLAELEMHSQKKSQQHADQLAALEISQKRNQQHVVQHVAQVTNN